MYISCKNECIYKRFWWNFLISVSNIDWFSFRKDKNCYPQMFLEECRYVVKKKMSECKYVVKEKKMSNYITDHRNIDDSDK